ncbi:MAG: DHA2 family efflux MFS transporter permease subunit [Novosphingobium sp.]
MTGSAPENLVPPAIPAQPEYPSPGRRLVITGSVMLASLIVALDMTIANVALPQMQSSLLASSEQIIWVLTSYLLASAIMTPLSSWLASRYGRRLVMGLSAAIFTAASLACGLSNGLTMMVVARTVQGIAGAGLIPLGLATLLDINPPERQGQAMAIAGLGTMAGPLIGPSLGGWLTDSYSWRWVFLINIPLGILAFAGIWAYLPDLRDRAIGKFDGFGFATVSLFLGFFQLMMDRGQMLDWFDSTEVCIETGLMLLAGFLGVVHMLTAKDTFVRAELFADRNFAIGCIIGAIFGLVVFATVPLVTVMMQAQLGYTSFHSGFVSMPRGAGSVVGLILVGIMITRVRPQVLLSIGLIGSAAGLFLFSRISLDTDELPLRIAGFIQGLFGGFIMTPLSMLVFSSLPTRLRNEGAAIFALTRNIGASLGISAIQVLTIHNTAAVTSRLTEGVRPDNPQLQMSAPQIDFDTTASLVAISRQIGRQAAMVATIDTLWVASLLAVATVPLVYLMKSRRPGADGAMPASAMMADAH